MATNRREIDPDSGLPLRPNGYPDALPSTSLAIGHDRKTFLEYHREKFLRDGVIKADGVGRTRQSAISRRGGSKPRGKGQ